MNADQFYAHLTECDQCALSDHADLCPTGREMLYEVADELPDEWQRELRRILRKEEVEREAAANAEYYAGSEEF